MQQRYNYHLSSKVPCSFGRSSSRFSSHYSTSCSNYTRSLFNRPPRPKFQPCQKRNSSRPRRHPGAPKPIYEAARNNPEGYNVEGLDLFFGIKPDFGKALRGGYGTVVNEPRGGWGKIPEFIKLLDSDSEDDSEATSDCVGSRAESSGRKRRPPPLNLSRARTNSSISFVSSLAVQDDAGHPSSAKTIASPYAFLPDPITKEIRRRASHDDGTTKIKLTQGLRRKKSVGAMLKGFCNSVSGNIKNERATQSERKIKAGPGHSF